MFEIIITDYRGIVVRRKQFVYRESAETWLDIQYPNAERLGYTVKIVKVA